jgi:hypothetical protein
VESWLIPRGDLGSRSADDRSAGRWGDYEATEKSVPNGFVPESLGEIATLTDEEIANLLDRWADHWPTDNQSPQGPR